MTDLNKKEYLNIAMLGHKRVPSREGGVEVVVTELSTRLAAQGHQVTCYNRTDGNNCTGSGDKDITEFHGIRLKKVFTIPRKGLAAATSSFFATLKVAFGKYDIIHFHAEGSCFFMWLPKLFGKRCILTIHGLDWQREKWKDSLGSSYIRHSEKAGVKHADEIIVLSREMQRYFLKNYGRETIYIPNGVNRPVKVAPELIKEKYGLEKDDYILFLGRIVPEKGLRYLVEAYKQLKTGKKLVIAGGSSDTDQFEAELKNLCAEDGRVLFTGFVEGQVLEELYSNAYLYVLPSDLEGMPLSLLEAMSYGNCCVVSDIPECTEVVEDEGVVIRRGNVKELRDKLQSLCDNPQVVERYKGTAADFICNKYNWDTVAEETLCVYRKQ
ncbi:MAG: glycosyltransferase family 4 protein [Lachnospiraceae bacterium]|nr:glycosyltransferase family 4 protein [Lachnospiraceae bacterium]